MNLDVYSNSILFEAFEPHVFILPPDWANSTTNLKKHEGIRVRISSPQTQVLVQLRPEDVFIVSSRRFSLAVSEVGQANVTTSASETITVVDLEEENEENGVKPSEQSNPNLLRASTKANVSSQPLVPNDAVVEQTLSSLEVQNHGPCPEPGPTVCEQPYGHPEGFADEVIRSILENAMNDQDDSQKWATDEEKRETMDMLRDAKRHSSTQGSTEQSDLFFDQNPTKATNSIIASAAADASNSIEADQRRNTSEVFLSTASAPRPDSDKESPDFVVQSHSHAQEDYTPSPMTHQTEQTINEQMTEKQTMNEQIMDEPTINKQLTDKQKPDEPTTDEQPMNELATNREEPVEIQWGSEGVEQMSERRDGRYAEAPSSLSDTTEASHEATADTIVVGRAALNTRLGEGSEPGPDESPEGGDVDTQDSTIARIDGLFELAEADSSASDNLYRTESDLAHLDTDGPAELMDDIAEPEDGPGSAPNGDWPATEDEDEKGSNNNRSGYKRALSSSGGSRALSSTRAKMPNKRKRVSPETNSSSNSKNSAKKRKLQDTQESMESTIRLSAPSSQRKDRSAPTSLKEDEENSAASIDLSLSTRSHTATEDPEINVLSYSGPPPTILFSSNTTVDDKPHLMSFLHRHGGRKVNAIKDCNFLCVGSGELRKTSKLLLAVAFGKDIVRDKWLIDSARKGHLLSPAFYVAEDAEREAEWGVKLKDSIARGKAGLEPFAGWTIYFTPTLKKELGNGFVELKELALLVGAKAVYAKIPKGAQDSSETLVLASEDDKDAAILEKAGWRCHSKDIISLGVLRGQFDPGSEDFTLKPSDSQRSKGSKGSKKIG